MRKHYNVNTLLRAIDIQRITHEHTQRGITQKWVFDNIIQNQYRMSQRTYYRYLQIPAGVELRKLKIKF